MSSALPPPIQRAVQHTLLSARDLAELRDYLRMLVVRSAALTLPSAIEEEIFDFRQRTLRGAKGTMLPA